ncbi:diaminopimelate decarboxylase [Candidatus Halobeggiatoa sp. HSG11]|nr:diaminopimelate decarboxylase [Candidatus Halobeggiatoa sp. HSG11]
MLKHTIQNLKQITERYQTPFYLYDEARMLDNAQKLNAAFTWNNDFKEYFAVKANPNPYILKLLKNQGFGMDCSSLPELLLAEKCGLAGEDIMFSSNNTPIEEFAKAIELGAIINLDDINHIDFLKQHLSLPELICFRYNPGNQRTGSTIIGYPEEAKFGFTRDQLFAGYRLAKDYGIKRFGIHAMIASNELEPSYFIETAEMLFKLVKEISTDIGIKFEFVNIGGGIGIPYRPDEQAVDLNVISEGIKNSYKSHIEANNQAPLKLYMECGRMITGPYGYLVTKVRHIKQTYKNFAGLDACMANLMRPGIYPNAYHHITVLGKEDLVHDILYDVTGSLCENNDKFAIDRKLPQLDIGDIVIIHDVGAHGHTMGFNYNGKLRSAELLLRKNGEIVEIRRAETIDDHFATLDFDGLARFI